MSYLKNYTNSADLFETTVKVTKEDKKDGTLGIRSIWENIHSGQAFTVCFKKQDKPKSKKKLNEEIDYLVDQFSKDIDKVKASKKEVAERASTPQELRLIADKVEERLSQLNNSYKEE